MSPVVFGSIAALDAAVIAQFGYAIRDLTRHDDEKPPKKDEPPRK